MRSDTNAGKSELNLGLKYTQFWRSVSLALFVRKCSTQMFRSWSLLFVHDYHLIQPCYFVVPQNVAGLYVDFQCEDS